MKKHRVDMERYGVQITRKNGTRFLASDVGTQVAMFGVFSDACRFAKELREHCKTSRIRTVRVKATFTWETP